MGIICAQGHTAPNSRSVGEVPDKTKRGQQALANLVKSEIARWTPIIRAANIKGE